MLKKIALTLFSAVVVAVVYGQQDPQFTQYMFNQVSYNPGYIGSENAISATGLYRDQWVGFKDAEGNEVTPVDYLFSVHSPIKILRGGLGLTIVSDEIGFESNTTVKLGYAYHRTTATGQLGIGLMVGFMDKTIDYSKFKAVDDDPLLNSLSGEESSMLVDLSFGIHYQVPGTYYLGLSSTQLLQTKSAPLTDSQESEIRMVLKRHYYLTAGYFYTLPNNPSYEIMPSMLFKTDGASYAFDISALVRYNNRFWGGLSYRYQDAVSVILGMEYKNFHIGYSYDLTTSEISNAGSAGTHEVMAGYKFKLELEKISRSYKNTRFL